MSVRAPVEPRIEEPANVQAEQAVPGVGSTRPWPIHVRQDRRKLGRVVDDVRQPATGQTMCQLYLMVVDGFATFASARDENWPLAGVQRSEHGSDTSVRNHHPGLLHGVGYLPERHEGDAAHTRQRRQGRACLGDDFLDLRPRERAE